ncbi:MAG: DUF1553 domain-containing protein [Planctomycetes bacterium]|nr:DUF1553 domain-containing protein [Planctomycetota bacterium]
MRGWLYGWRTGVFHLAISWFALGQSAICPADESAPPKNSGHPPIDFAHDIAPIFQKRCAKCHTGTQKKGGLSFNNRQSLLTGGDSGPAAEPKKSSDSELIRRVTATDPQSRMPPEGERLTEAQVRQLQKWIDAGLPWEEGFTFGKLARQAPLAPRRPTIPDVPADSGLSNPIDRFLYRHYLQQQLSLTQEVGNQEFARRVSYDLIGLPPTAADLAELDRGRPGTAKRNYVAALLDQKEAYATHWLTFWNDLLRNAYHGTGFIDGGRKQITGWLYTALYDNLPYNRFAHELVSPPAGSGSEGFTYGIKWRGTVNESQRREIQAAQSVGQVFLGTNLKCASCHDSFVNHWKLTDAYALASVFADGKLELHKCDQPEGVPASVGFLYPELGAIDPNGSREARMKQLADLLVHEKNGRFTRTIVNRLWARLFGRGLVEPVDNMDAEPWNQDLLDFLATDLADHGYDLKHTLGLIATSHAYHLPAVPLDKATSSGEAYVFRGPLVKRVSAEQFLDTVYALTATWPTADGALLKADGRAQGGQLGAIAQSLANRNSSAPGDDRPLLTRAKWLWSRAEALQAAPPQTIYLRQSWSLTARPARAVATITADNACELFINGKSLAKSDNWNVPVQADVTAALVAGKNVIAIKAANGGGAPNPAGVIAEIAALDGDGKLQHLLSTDAAWRVSEADATGWQQPEFNDSQWAPAVVLGDAAVAPWNIAQTVSKGFKNLPITAALPDGFRIRAALLPLDTLQGALGRPNREQVVSSRDATPTMLQALELTNGTQLGAALHRGATYWHSQTNQSPTQIVNAIFQMALARHPSAEERQLAADMIGSPATVEGLEDFLWSICMLPEFQLIR